MATIANHSREQYIFRTGELNTYRARNSWAAALHSSTPSNSSLTLYWPHVSTVVKQSRRVLFMSLMSFHGQYNL